MTLIEIKQVPSPRRYGKQYRTVHVCKCDTCGETVEKFPCLAKKPEHFCSMKCADEAQKSGGVLFAKKTKIFNEKYGVDNPYQSEEVKAKMKETSLRIYGVDVPMRSDMLKEQMRQAFMKSFGATNPMRCPAIREKMTQTCRLRYGVDNPNQSPVIL